MLEEWWRHAVTLVTGSVVWLALLKFFGARELKRMDDAIAAIPKKADSEPLTVALNKIVDRLTALETNKADRDEILAAVEKIERKLDEHSGSRQRMYEKFDSHAAELHRVDATLQRLFGRLEGQAVPPS